MIKVFDQLDEVKIVNTGNKYGIMSESSRFYPRTSSKEKRALDLMRRKELLAYNRGFNPEKMFLALGQTGRNDYHIITKDNANGSGCNFKETILILTREIEGVLIGSTTADNPVVVIEDSKSGVTAMARCDGWAINRALPMAIVSVLNEEFQTTPKDIKVYIGACVGKNFKYYNWPEFARREELWKNSVKLANSNDLTKYYYVDFHRAITDQLTSVGVLRERIIWNTDNTLKNDAYFTDLGSKMKRGRNLVGAYYEDKQLIKYRN